MIDEKRQHNSFRTNSQNKKKDKGNEVSTRIFFEQAATR